MMSEKNHKGIAVLSTLLTGLVGLIFYTIYQFQLAPSFLSNPNSLNMIFVLVFSIIVIGSLGILYYLPKNN